MKAQKFDVGKVLFSYIHSLIHCYLWKISKNVEMFSRSPFMIRKLFKKSENSKKSGEISKTLKPYRKIKKIYCSFEQD